MTSILPQINGLNEIPHLHDYYAKRVLFFIIEKLHQDNSVDIGVMGNGGSSLISFDTDDWENTKIDLRYKNGKFSIKIRAFSRDDDKSSFYYYLHEPSEMYDMIPIKLRITMADVAMECEPRILEEIF